MIQVAERTHAARRRLAVRQASGRIDRWKARWTARGPARPGHTTLQVPKAAPGRLWAALACCVALGACLAGGVAVWQANPGDDDANLQEATGVAFNPVLAPEKPVPAPRNPAFAPRNPAFAPPKPVVAPDTMVHVEAPATRKLGTFRVTAYCPCKRCTPGSGITSTGKGAWSRGIAVDPSVVPYGTRLWVPGYGECVADDSGSAIKGRRLDVRFTYHRQAKKWGVKKKKVVYLLRS